MATNIFRIVSRRLWPRNVAFCANQIASFRSTAARFSYEGDGKTTMASIEKEVGQHLLITGYNDVGFRLSNGSMVLGPCILFPNLIFQWNVKSLDEINEDSLSVFKLIEPRLEIIILGIGDQIDCTLENITKLRQIVKQMGLNIEIMSTRNAVSTYNFILGDFRVVAGAFLVPKNSKEQMKLLQVKTEKTGLLDFKS